MFLPFAPPAPLTRDRMRGLRDEEKKEAEYGCEESKKVMKAK